MRITKFTNHVIQSHCKKMPYRYQIGSFVEVNSVQFGHDQVNIFTEPIDDGDRGALLF